MIQKEIGKAVVQVAVDGLSNVKKQLGDLKNAASVGTGGGKASGGGGGLLGNLFGSGGMSAMSKVVPMLAKAGPYVAAIAVAVGAVAGAALVGAVAVKKLVSTMLDFASVADPGRAELFAQKVESTSVIIGKLFIPVLQVAIKTVDQVNAALRKFAGSGGVANFVRTLVVGFERLAKWAMPLFEAGLSAVDKLAKALTPTFDTLNDIMSDIFNAFDMKAFTDGLGVLVDVTAKIIQGWGIALKLAWDLFGPQTLLLVKAFILHIQMLADLFKILFVGVQASGDSLRNSFLVAIDAVLASVNWLIRRLNDLVDLLNEITRIYSKFTTVQVGKIGKVGELNREDVIAKPKDRAKEKAEYTNQGLLTPKVETFGIEEAFKKAQSAAGIAKLSDYERQSLDIQKQIAANTVKANPAQMAY